MLYSTIKSQLLISTQPSTLTFMSFLYLPSHSQHTHLCQVISWNVIMLREEAKAGVVKCAERGLWLWKAHRERSKPELLLSRSTHLPAEVYPDIDGEVHLDLPLFSNRRGCCLTVRVTGKTKTKNLAHQRPGNDVKTANVTFKTEYTRWRKQHAYQWGSLKNPTEKRTKHHFQFLVKYILKI